MVFFLLPFSSFGETSAVEKLSKDLVGSWLVSVAHEERTRLLKISEVLQGSGDVYQLSALYGWSDGKQTPIKVEATQTASGPKLTLVTQADTVIVVSKDSNTTYIGTFTLKNGNVKEVRISKLSDTDLQKLESGANKEVVFEKPSKEVPESCAFFVGKWKGGWRNANLERWLLVTKVDENCVATYYFGTQERPKNYKKTIITDGVIVWPCPNNTNCTAVRKGDVTRIEYRSQNSEDYDWGDMVRIQ
jgi:hypothetical protein